MRIIISIGMLKEGSDVKNVYVIASMRASVSTVLTEQTLGRGMRLPFGRYTQVEFLDTLEVLAHEKYGDLLKKRSVLNEAFIDYGTYADLRRAVDGSLEVRQTAIPAPGPVIPTPRPSEPAQTSEPAVSEGFLLSPGLGDFKSARDRQPHLPSSRSWIRRAGHVRRGRTRSPTRSSSTRRCRTGSRS